MPFRFVHTADLHLDSPLRSLALRDPDLAGLIGDATRRAFSNLVDLCIDEGAEALMIAGDLYDGDQTSMKTALFLADCLRRLDEAGVRTFIVRGNHDAESRITRELALPEGAKAFRGRSEAAMLDRPDGAFPVAVHGVSFGKPHAPESLVPKFRPPVPGAFNIGLLHTSLGGVPGHDPYAPCSVADLAGTGFDYWCLGHVHKRAVHREKPHVVMPGMPQGRHIGEAGPKSVTLVRVADDGSVACEERAVSVAQFERVTVDLAGVADWREMTERIGASLERARAGLRADRLVARLELTGGTPLNWRLRRERELVEGEARHCAGAAGNSWIEKVELATGEPGNAAADAGAVAELAGTMSGSVARSEEFRAQADRIMEEIELALPPDARRALGDSAEERAETLAGLIDEGRQTVLARLREGAPGEAD